MPKSENQSTFLELIYIFGMLIFASSIISVFKARHFEIGLLFIAMLFIYMIKTYRIKTEEKSIFWFRFFGIGLTIILGLLVEIWGTSNGFWVYNAIPNNTYIPFWVPFAWGLSYKTLHKTEQILLPYFTSAFNKWFFCVILPAILLPVIGEIFVINFGTWYYTWQPQFFGVPYIAMFLLGIFHVGVFLIMRKVCQLFAINDLVYDAFITK